MTRFCGDPNCRKDHGYFAERIASGYRVDCQTDEEGRIVGLRDSLGRTAEYRYDGSKLVMSRDAGGNTYEHEYDSKVNMTRIAYQDGTSLRIEYDAKGFTSSMA